MGAVSDCWGSIGAPQYDCSARANLYLLPLDSPDFGPIHVHHQYPHVVDT